MNFLLHSHISLNSNEFGGLNYCIWMSLKKFLYLDVPENVRLEFSFHFNIW